jgi:hypothetical protein
VNELTAEFSVKDGVEVVSLSGAFMGKDVVTRAVTDADRRQYSDEYEAFKNPPAAPVPVPVAAPAPVVVPMPVAEPEPVA